MEGIWLTHLFIGRHISYRVTINSIIDNISPFFHPTGSTSDWSANSFVMVVFFFQRSVRIFCLDHYQKKSHTYTHSVTNT